MRTQPHNLAPQTQLALRRRKRGKRAKRHGPTGFTLVELLLVLTVGVVVCAAMVQLLLSESRGTELLAQRLRAGLEQRRALELIREDVQRSSRVSLAAVTSPACPLAGRSVVLHLEGLPTVVTYSVGSAPSSIWQGLVLMRCGPAFGLDGKPSAGSALNRVLLDSLPAEGLRVVERTAGRLELELRQELPERNGQRPQIASALVMAAP
ncbi:MAG: prepilin-type N-terminal cleavage/methylation domain-containing protein [Synechococcaceae cyanobacterium]